VVEHIDVVPPMVSGNAPPRRELSKRRTLLRRAIRTVTETVGGHPMKYALLVYNPAENGPTHEDYQAMIPEWYQVTQDLVGSGDYVTGEALMPSETATTLTAHTGSRLTTDGPFAETKDLLAGFYVIDVEDLDAALVWAEKLPTARYGKVEIRPCVEFETPVEGA
jgi:hypothetical protein